ncbi:MAG TPA: hypothetical protein VFY71_15730 [Planctomycetota bacterium]|nr:hypothetical protein [Planctomycetota bacterium]
MSKHVTLMVVLAMLLAPSLGAQVPGAYPHLQLTNGLGPLVPPATGPFDNSNVFPAFSGQSFQARISYASAGQPNPNVLWAVLVSATPTPYSTTLIPPKLLTMPPVILLMPTPMSLSVSGQGTMNLFVPAGILDAQTYLQALIYDSTHSPPMVLSNGLLVDVDVPSFSVDFAWARATQATTDETLLHDTGAIVIGPDEMPQLKPIGTQAPPVAVPGPPFFADSVRFLGIAPNEADEPVNPRARPFTKLTAAATATDTEIIVQDTSFFPSRGHILVSASSENPWASKTGGAGQYSPRVESITYEGKQADRFLNCKRTQIGSSIGKAAAAATTFPHAIGDMVLGDYTLATTSGAKARTRVGLDADNDDMPHVVIPAFQAPTGEEGQLVTQDLDLYLFETNANAAQGFVVFDRVTHAWRMIQGSLMNPLQGRWNPMVCVAPDGRSFIAELVVSGGVLSWNNAPNLIFAFRTDGLDWPASGTETWQIPYQIEPDPGFNDTTVRSRRVSMLATAIIGPDTNNYVAYVGLAHKWKFTTASPGSNFVDNKGYEGDWVREEVYVRDYIDIPLVAPGSGDAPPTLPRTYIAGQFGTTGLLNPIIRFDPECLPTTDHKGLLVTGGGGQNADQQEDVFYIRNIGITSAGAVTKTLTNLTGFSDSGQNAGATHVRQFVTGGHGQGRKAAFSPGGTRVAWTANKKGGSLAADWLQWANTNGSSFGKVKNVYADASGNFKVAGPYVSDRALTGLRWVDENRLLFMMGKNPWDDIAAVTASNAPQFDLFVYDVSTDTMTNLTLTGASGNGFATLGKIQPDAFFASPSGDFCYCLRGTAAVSAGAPAVLNVIGVNTDTLDVFSVSGPDFGGSSLIPSLELPTIELLSQVESPGTMHFVEGSGVQQGLMYYTEHEQGGNASDEVIALNTDMPFVAFQVTNTTKASLAIAELTPNPYGGTVAFARTDGANPLGATQHPFVVDLDNFLFERDLLPMWVSGGANMGRVMGGSCHFVAPGGTAGDALVFSFGFGALPNGIALMATPAYYPLAAVSDLLAQPVPIVIPLVDTQLLGTDYRFYVPDAHLAGN